MNRHLQSILMAWTGMQRKAGQDKRRLNKVSLLWPSQPFIQKVKGDHEWQNRPHLRRAHSFLLSEDSEEASGERTIRHHLRSHFLLTRGWTSLCQTGVAFRSSNASPHRQLWFFPSVIQAAEFLLGEEIISRSQLQACLPSRSIGSFSFLLPVSSRSAWHGFLSCERCYLLDLFIIILTTQSEINQVRRLRHHIRLFTFMFCSTNVAHLQESVSD